MKAIEEVTYYCKDCQKPFADETTIVGDQVVKTGALICLQCGREIEAKKRFI